MDLGITDLLLGKLFGKSSAINYTLSLPRLKPHIPGKGQTPDISEKNYGSPASPPEDDQEGLSESNFNNSAETPKGDQEGLSESNFNNSAETPKEDEDKNLSTQSFDSAPKTFDANDTFPSSSMDAVGSFFELVQAERGLAHNNRFKVIISNPKNISNPAESLFKLGLMCHSATIPGIQLDTTDYSTFRNSYKTPRGYTLPECSLTYYLTNDFTARVFFERWMNVVIDPVDYRLNYMSDFSANLEIHHLPVDHDRSGKENYAITLLEAYPTSVSAIELSNGSLDFLKVTVNFAYTQFTSGSLAYGTT